VNSRHIPELGWFLVVLQPEGGTVRTIRKTLLGNLALCAANTTLVLLVIHKTIGRYQERIEKLATTDNLTGLPSRQAFNLLYETAVQDCRRHRTEGALLILDLDRFKNVNDTYGHLAGDAILRAVAERVRASVRASDLFCRWGGEEFIILLRHCPQADARRVADMIRRRIEEMTVDYQGQELRITASFGVAMIGKESRDEVLQKADEAMYRAKANGRNRVEG
jgi:diguanylate cyclase (GGDEF)-like protein